MTASSEPVWSPAVGLGLVVATLAVANVARSTVVPSGWHLWFNLATGAVVVALSVAAGLDADGLGVGRDHLGPGLRLGGLAFAVISLGVLALGLAGALTDDRAHVGLGTMLLRALVLIPLGTVLVEELAFRGALHGLLAKVASPAWTMALGAVLFGLWHVLPAWRGGAVETDVAEVGRLATVAGTLAFTTLAGVGFVWLRVRSGSVAAPMLAHLATNSVTFALAWAFR